MLVATPHKRVQRTRIDHPGVGLVYVCDAAQLHCALEFVLQDFGQVLHALLSVREGIEVRSTDAHRRGAQRERLEDVGAACDAAVDVDFEFVGCEDPWADPMDLEEGEDGGLGPRRQV